MQFFTVNDIADKLKVHPATVKRWLREGKLGGILLGDRAGWRISEEDYARFLERQRAETDPRKAAA
jgi:excisionase family DNA binding protein